MSVAIVSDTCHYLPRERGRPSRASTRSASTCAGPRAPSASPRSPITTPTTGAWAPSADLPSTSQPSIGDFLAVYEPLLDAATRSSRSTSPAACRAPSARPSRPASSSATGPTAVHVFDSATACGGEGLVVLAAAAAAARRRHRRRGARARPARPGRAQDVVRDRHARVPAPRRPDRRRAGLARLGAEDQADPHRRVRDHPDRARPHLAPRLRADGRSAAQPPRGRRRRLDGPAHPGARRGRRAGRARAARSSAGRPTSSPRSGP